MNGFSFEANRIGFSVFVEDVQLHGFEVVVRVNVDFRPEVKVVSVEGEGLVYFFHIFKVTGIARESRDFFNLYDVEVEGVSHAQGFFNLMGYPTDTIGENFKRRG